MKFSVVGAAAIACALSVGIPSTSSAATEALTSVGYDLSTSAPSAVSDPSPFAVESTPGTYKVITDSAGNPIIVESVPGLTAEIVNTFDQYVKYDAAADRFILKLPAKQFDPAQVKIVQDSVSQANKDATSSDGGMASFNASVAANKSTRHGGVHRHWWGLTLWLDEFATNRLEAALATGSGASWVAAEVTSWTGIGGLTAGAIAAILAATGGIVWLCDWNGRGINIEESWWGSWCWPR